MVRQCLISNLSFTCFFFVTEGKFFRYGRKKNPNERCGWSWDKPMSPNTTANPSENTPERKAQMKNLVGEETKEPPLPNFAGPPPSRPPPSEPPTQAVTEFGQS